LGTDKIADFRFQISDFRFKVPGIQGLNYMLTYAEKGTWNMEP
jgi:hypothetical protein